MAGSIFFATVGPDSEDFDFDFPIAAVGIDLVKDGMNGFARTEQRCGVEKIFAEGLRWDGGVSSRIRFAAGAHHRVFSQRKRKLGWLTEV
jgi:hypothetical protein